MNASRMLAHCRTLLLLLTVIMAGAAQAQPYLSSLSADADAPLFATYAAPMERSAFTIDEGYHFRYYAADQPVEFVTDSAGSLGLLVRVGETAPAAAGEMYERPVVTTSYSDLVRFHYRPVRDLRVDAHFQVYSSRLALYNVVLTNTGNAPLTLDLVPYLRHEMSAVDAAPETGAVTFRHSEPPDDWTLSHGVPYASDLQNVLVMNTAVDAAAAVTGISADGAIEAIKNLRLASSAGIPADTAAAVVLRNRMELAAGETKELRIVRGVADAESMPATLLAEADALLTYDTDVGVAEAEQRYARIPRIPFEDANREATYWNAFSLMSQVMMPPEGQSAYNYYVFSREPTWGWGHGGQVFHESLTMLAYVFMDPASAMNSQRVYMERQHEDGYINYRTGSYLNETIVTDGKLTLSAPWYNWINWELYRQTEDESFLREAYASGAAFYEWWLENRDADGDGLAEWGAHGVLESVRDGYVAVWDEVGWPSNFEAVDLNSMLVMEARSLGSMAEALGDSAEAGRWRSEAARRSEAINDVFWDEDTGFYYHVDRDDHDFTFGEPDDLKRQEIVGLLPLWAGIADDEQAARLVDHITNPQKFWRPYGVPTLAADDPYYDPMGYWNGPVWVEWQYLLFRGLLDYGRADLAEELADRVLTNVTYHLTDSHTFWELYSPDALEAGHHQTYIWTALVARMMLDLSDTDISGGSEP